MLKLSYKLGNILNAIEQSLKKGFGVYFVKVKKTEDPNLSVLVAADKGEVTNRVSLGGYLYTMDSQIALFDNATVKEPIFKLLVLFAKQPLEEQKVLFNELMYLIKHSVVDISRLGDHGEEFAVLAHDDRCVDPDYKHYNTLVRNWFTDVELTKDTKKYRRLNWWLKHGLVKQ